MSLRKFSTSVFSPYLCVLLAFVLATAPSASVVAQTAAAQQADRQRGGRSEGQPSTRPAAQQIAQATQAAAEATPAAPSDTAYISPNAVGIVVLRPAQIMSAPMAELLPVEVASAAGLKYVGVDPADVEEVVAFVGQINPTAPPEYGLTIKFAKPFRGSSIRQELRAHTQVGELNGKRYLQSQNPMLPSFYAPNNTALVVAPDATLRRLVASAGQPKTGSIVDRLKNAPAGNDLYAVADVANLRPLIQMYLAQAQAQVPPDAQPFLEAPNLISAAELTLNLSTAGPVRFVVHANDKTAGQRLESLLADASRKYQQHMITAFAEQAASEDPVERATAQYMERVSGSWTEPFMPERDGSSLTFFKSEGDDPARQHLTNVAMIGILVALILPAVQAAREAARRAQSANNMKQLMLSLLNHEAAHRSYPAHASYSPDGKPLLSWRVHILPYIEQQALYQQFHLDEPWDSEHNRALIAQMPATYANPNREKDGKTNYLAVVGAPCVFDGTAKGKQIHEIIDGTTNTIVLVEANTDQAVEWTRPDDWEYDPNRAIVGLGELRPGVWLAAFADGHVDSVANGIDQDQLKAMFTRAGGETPVNGL